MVQCMPHLQIRNVPAPLHRTLKARAAHSGLSLSDYLLNEIREFAAVPTPEEMRERLALLSSEDPPESSADAIRAERDRS
jgi:plasmid stability protein